MINASHSRTTASTSRALSFLLKYPNDGDSSFTPNEAPSPLNWHPSAPGSALQVGVQGIKALEGRDRHQEVAPHIADHPLDLPLVVALAGTAEPVIEQVVRLEFREGPGALPPSIPQDPGHRQLGVVVQDALGALRPGMRRPKRGRPGRPRWSRPDRP